MNKIHIPIKYKLLPYDPLNYDNKMMVNISIIESFIIVDKTIIAETETDTLTFYFKSKREALNIGKFLTNYSNQLSTFQTQLSLQEIELIKNNQNNTDIDYNEVD